MRSRLSWILAVCFLGLSARAENLRLALNWKAEPQFGGFYQALRDDLFKKAGLEVQILEGGSGTPTIQMVVSGKTEYAVVSADEVVLSHARGAKNVIALFATYQTNPQAIMTHEARDYKSLDELLADPKATLLWQAGLPYALFLKKTRPNFKAKTAPYLGGLTHFQKDPMVAQQAFITSEPLAARRAGLPHRAFLVADAGYNPYTTVLVTQADRWKEKPEEVKKVVAAVREGWSRYLKDPTATNAFMHGLNKSMDLDTFGESARAQTDLIQVPGRPLGEMSEGRWRNLVDQLSDLKLIKTKPEPSSLFVSLEPPPAPAPAPKK